MPKTRVLDVHDKNCSKIITKLARDPTTIALITYQDSQLASIDHVSDLGNISDELFQSF